MPSPIAPVSRKATTNKGSSSRKATINKGSSSRKFTLPEPLHDALVAVHIMKPPPTPPVKRYEMPLPEEHFEDVIRFDMVGLSRFERMKKRTAHVNATFNKKMDAMNEVIRREMRERERISTSRKIKQALHMKVEPLPSEKPIPVILPSRGGGYAIFDDENSDVSSEAKKEVEDDKIIKAMLQNEKRGTLTALPANILDTIANSLTGVDIMCLRQTSHRFLRHFDIDDNDDNNEEDAGNTIKFSHFRVDDFGFSPLKVHAYAQPWDPHKLGSAEATAEFKARLQRDLFCNDCQATRQAENYHTRVMALKKLMHCRDCQCDHPAVLFSADIRNKTDDEHRVCVGRQGAVHICSHSTLRYQDVEETRTRLEPGSAETIVCSRHEPSIGGSTNSTTKTTTGSSQEPFRPTATLKKDEDNDKMIVTLSSEGDLCFGIHANDCTAQAMRDWLAYLSGPDNDTGLVLCPHLSLTDGNGAAAVIEGMWEPAAVLVRDVPGRGEGERVPSACAGSARLPRLPHTRLRHQLPALQQRHPPDYMPRVCRPGCRPRHLHTL